MKEKHIKNPGPDHPISIQHNRARVVVSVAGRVIADTRNALALREADYPAVQYIPREDVDLTQLERTDSSLRGASGRCGYRQPLDLRRIRRRELDCAGSKSDDLDLDS